MLYMGLRAIADCAGNLEYRPRRIKVEIFPYDDDLTFQAVESLIESLIEIGYAITYTVNGERYLNLPWFERDENVSTHEKRDGAKHPCFQQQSADTLPRQCEDSVQAVCGQCEDTPLTVTVTVTDTVTRTAETSPPPNPRVNAPPHDEPNAPEARKVPPKVEIIPARERWRLDEHYELLRGAYELVGVRDLVPEDWSEAYPVWLMLDSEQRTATVDAMHERIAAGADSQYIPRPKRWLRGEYKRPIREPTLPPVAQHRGRRSTFEEVS